MLGEFTDVPGVGASSAPPADRPVFVMTAFRLKQMSANSATKVAGAIRWNYDRAELIADGIVHGLGVFAGLIALTVLIVLTAVFASATELVTVSIYAAGLLAMLGF